ncbi:ABC transporter permease, partial [Streptomyces resistomycificus]|uniref:ABC transporter permease n=1 Tax=Streptomyces resistomycificus TaxID=67356 RepID=UPI00068F57DC
MAGRDWAVEKDLGARSSRVVDGLRAYRMITAMWIRSTMAYRASFLMTTFGNFVATALDFVAVLLMFSRVDELGGCLLYTLDTLMVRPAPVLAQMAADQFGLRRLGRVTQGVLVLGYALATVDIDWTWAKVLLMPVMLVSGAAIFCAVFVAGASFQFVAQDAAEVQNAFTYGGTTLLQYPPTLFATELVRGVTFVLPLAFVNWVPATYVLGMPLPLGLPGWAAFLPPLVAGG